MKNTKLEFASFPVENVRFGDRASYNNGVLGINKEALISLVLEDKRITSAEMDVAFPNEQTRIIFVRDVIEPRVKISGPGCV
ncbi:MAG: beta-aspartyl-peptidase, partial [Chloroflexi bacterium]|nr:beta-aspartyl-peptidase [Chloroflexota bacterium]